MSLDRFWSRVDKTDTCWLWTGATQSRGYGMVRVDGALHLTHRLAYELLVGPIPDGLTIDHLCRVKPCVNPSHMETVTRAENTIRSNVSDSCRQGHPWTEESTANRVRNDGRRHRECLICLVDRRQRRSAA